MTGPATPITVAHPDVEIIETTTPFQRFLRIDTIRFRHRLFSGAWSAEHTYDVLRRGAAVAVALYDPDRDAVVLIEQFRLAALFAESSARQLEVVSGLVDTDETPEMVALRETREETSLTLNGELIPIQRYLPSCGASDESVHLFCARVDSSTAGGVHGSPVEGEDIRTVVKTMTEIEALLDAGAIENGHTVIALYWLLRHRADLRARWIEK
ncbi:MAG: NUDIX domain-containing protein [Stellaceae bacterium]